MKHRIFLPSSLCLLVALSGCSVPAASPEPTRPVAVEGHQLVAAIRAAGEREDSVISVSALQDPAAAALQQQAQADESAGRIEQAAATLDRALAMNPDSPDLLQQRAEVAVLRGDYSRAEQLAHRSWAIGPRLGPLCARNWQTVAEMRRQAGDTAGAERARHWLDECHKPGVNRF